MGRIFISAVSNEFGSYRSVLNGRFGIPEVDVKIQDNFRNVALGRGLLEKLDTYIRHCNAVVHLVGDMTGICPDDVEIEKLLAKHRNISTKPQLKPLAQLIESKTTISLTQWEAWLALYHDKPLFIVKAAGDADRDSRFRLFSPNNVSLSADEQRTSQDAHLVALKNAGCEWPLDFKNVNDIFNLIGSGVIHAVLEDKVDRGNIPFECPPSPPALEVFGRSKQVSDVVRRLENHSLTTVVGPAGMGKTAVAWAALREIVGDSAEWLAASPFPDGVVFIDLSNEAHADAETVWKKIADMAGAFKRPSNMTHKERAEFFCKGKQMLFIFEGAEIANGITGAALNTFLPVTTNRCNKSLVLTREKNQTLPSTQVGVGTALESPFDGQLLDKCLGNMQVNPAQKKELLELLAGHPLAITWAGGILAREDEAIKYTLQKWHSDPLLTLSDPTDAKRTLKWIFSRGLDSMPIPLNPAQS